MELNTKPVRSDSNVGRSSRGIPTLRNSRNIFARRNSNTVTTPPRQAEPPSGATPTGSNLRRGRSGTLRPASLLGRFSFRDGAENTAEHNTDQPITDDSATPNAPTSFDDASSCTEEAPSETSSYEAGKLTFSERNGTNTPNSPPRATLSISATSSGTPRRFGDREPSGLTRVDSSGCDIVGTLAPTASPAAEQRLKKQLSYQPTMAARAMSFQPIQPVVNKRTLSFQPRGPVSTPTAENVEPAELAARVRPTLPGQEWCLTPVRRVAIDYIDRLTPSAGARMTVFQRRVFRLPYSAVLHHVGCFRRVILTDLCPSIQQGGTTRAQDEALIEIWYLVRDFIEAVFQLEDHVLFPLLDNVPLAPDVTEKLQAGRERLLRQRGAVREQIGAMNSVADSLFVTTLAKIEKRVAFGADELERATLRYLTSVLATVGPFLENRYPLESILVIERKVVQFFSDRGSDRRHHLTMLSDWMSRSQMAEYKRRNLDIPTKVKLSFSTQAHSRVCRELLTAVRGQPKNATATAAQ